MFFLEGLNTILSGIQVSDWDGDIWIKPNGGEEYPPPCSVATFHESLTKN
jgi:hypothetical protein